MNVLSVFRFKFSRYIRLTCFVCVIEPSQLSYLAQMVEHMSWTLSNAGLNPTQGVPILSMEFQSKYPFSQAQAAVICATNAQLP